MIEYTTGNLLDADAEALVNTVNTVGVMGKGIALMFKEAFPENFKKYEAACKSEQVQVGHMFVTGRDSVFGPRWIINFPTKKHWRQPTKLDWIKEGLDDLVSVIQDKKIKSIALPPLGCGNGGLDWTDVRPVIDSKLRALKDVHVIVFEPISKYQNVAKHAGVQKLTPARALVTALVRQYWILGIECTLLEVQKLAWFLERNVERTSPDNPLDLRFEANRYGPYASRLHHLLDSLDGSYLHCEKRLADAGPLDVIWFDEGQKEYLQTYLKSQEVRPYLNALENTSKLIDGFESPLGMELLSTVDWLLFKERCKPTIEDIKNGLKHWPGGHEAAERKAKLFDERLIGLALDRLSSQSTFQVH